jgi:hypothetical protein
MATGCDVTGSDVIRPKVGDSLWDVILVVRDVVYRRKNIGFPLPVGPAITLVNGCTHGMK